MGWISLESVSVTNKGVLIVRLLKPMLFPTGKRHLHGLEKSKTNKTDKYEWGRNTKHLYPVYKWCSRMQRDGTKLEWRLACCFYWDKHYKYFVISSSPFIFISPLEFVLHADKFRIALKVGLGKDVERGSRMWYEWKLKLWCLAVCVFHQNKESILIATQKRAGDSKTMKLTL